MSAGASGSVGERGVSREAAADEAGALAGVAYLVGAGPGDPGLLTARALELIASADAILYDRLIPDGALDGARADAELVYVGKRPAEPSMPQQEIERRIVELARAGRSVVRLKGGDPFVFGRGGEEAEALAAAGLRFEVVPGVTAGVAAPAYAGIPVTHRDDASAVAFVTGHLDPSKDAAEAAQALDLDALARFPGTLVFYMGVGRAAQLAEGLIAAGRPADEPAAAIERGTQPGQRVAEATLGTLAEAIEAKGLRPPAVLLTGSVARRREALAWLEARPLHGRRVVVTRARAQASALAARLCGLGAEVVEVPSIRIESRLDAPEVERALDEIHTYALVCFTSPNAVRLLFEGLAARELDARALAQAKVAAIGAGTARSLREVGLIADIVPERSIAESLIEALEPLDIAGKPVLVPRAAEARDVLPDALAGRGAKVDVVPVYETVRESPDPEALARVEDADYATFTSSSTVRNFLAAAREHLTDATRIVSIGPVTSDTAREHGLTVHVEAERHDPDGLVEALLTDAAGSPG